MSEYTHYSLKISENLLSDLREYCKLNNLKLSDYIEELIQKGFTDDKFGDAPFLKKKDNVSKFLSSEDLALMINSSVKKEEDAVAEVKIDENIIEKTETQVDVKKEESTPKIKRRTLKTK